MSKLGESPSRLAHSCHGWEKAPAPSQQEVPVPYHVGHSIGHSGCALGVAAVFPKKQGEDGREGKREGGRERMEREQGRCSSVLLGLVLEVTVTLPH